MELTFQSFVAEYRIVIYNDRDKVVCQLSRAVSHLLAKFYYKDILARNIPYYSRLLKILQINVPFVNSLSGKLLYTSSLLV